ncbi:MAG: ribosome-binding factor A [Acidimicrobiia bacterium]|nr:MAG: ribosome-binding factor A [Acidimicrobiia bacterium]
MRRDTTPRMRKVNELLREVIADAVSSLKDPGLGFLTITGVDTSPDLRTAVVFYTVLGSDEDREATAAALERATPRLHAIAGSQIRMKYTPRLTFLVDASIEEGEKIDRLLRGLSEESEPEWH